MAAALQTGTADHHQMFTLMRGGAEKVDWDWINSWEEGLRLAMLNLVMLNRLWMLTWAEAQWELWDREGSLGAATL